MQPVVKESIGATIKICEKIAVTALILKNYVFCPITLLPVAFAFTLSAAVLARARR
jgi:hypothetical protein